MERVHLLEIHELPECPHGIRDGITDFMQATIRGFGIFKPISHVLARAVQQTGAERVVDLCAGGGGPWIELHRLLEQDAGRAYPVVMTDKFPSQTARDRVAARHLPGLTYVERSVDAAAVPADLTGFRTIFNCFHQFTAEQARDVLKDAVRQRQGIAVFELTERTWLSVFMSLGLPGIVLAVTPFIRPFRWSRLFWTYVLPVLPVVVAFDAVVSCLRTYEPEELAAIAEGLGGDDWVWETGKVRVPWMPMRVTYLVGRPRTD